MVKNSSKNQAFSLIELSIVVLIIGILIAGVTQGSRLVAQSKIKVAQNSTQASPVTSIPDLALWLETTLDDSIVSVANGRNPENGDLVSAWNDINTQSISKLSAVQDTTSNQPKYIKNGIAGLPSLSFNGTSNFLSIASPPILKGNKGYTMIAVWQTASIAGTRVVMAQDTYAGSCGGNFSGFLTGGSTISLWFCGGGWDWDSAFTAVVGTPYIETAVINHSLTQNVSFYVNRIKATTSTTPTSPSSYSVSNSNFTIGNGGGGGGGATNVYFFNGYISEIIIYNRSLKASEVTDIQNYLSKKYSITLS